MKLTDSAGTILYEGQPTTVFPTVYEKLPGGSEKRSLPFRASATFAGATNSTAIDALTFAAATVRLELLPDLTITSFSGPPEKTRIKDPDSPGSYTITIKVRNDGPVAARNAALNVSIGHESIFLRYINLAAGEERTFAFEWVEYPGTHDFKASIDDSRYVTETNERNNLRDFISESRTELKLPRYTWNIQLVLMMVMIGCVIFGLGRN